MELFLEYSWEIDEMLVYGVLGDFVGVLLKFSLSF